MKILPFLVGSTVAKTSAGGGEPDDDCCEMFAVYGDVRTASLVVFGGGFLVALSSSWLKLELVEVRIVAVFTCRKIVLED